MSFANTFRRNRACERCRKLRVKCSYADPSSEFCLRCLKSRQETCVTLDGPRSGNGGASSSGGITKTSNEAKPALGGNAKAAIDEDVFKKRRVSELKKLIRTSQQELSKLGEPDVQDSLDQENCVITGINMGQFKAEEASEYFDIFQQEVTSELPFQTQKGLSLMDHANFEPLTALAMAITAKVNQTRESGELMVQFISKLVGMRTFVAVNEKSERIADLLKALGVINTYIIQDRQGVEPQMFQLAAANVVLGTFGSRRGWGRSLVHPDDMERARLYLGTAVGLATYAFNSGKFQYFNTLPIEGEEELLNNFFDKGEDMDRLLYYRIQMLLTAKQGLDELDQLVEPSFKSLKVVTSRVLNEITQLKGDAEVLSGGKLRISNQPFDMWYHMFVVPVLQAALERLVISQDHDPSHYKDFGEEVVKLGHGSITRFKQSFERLPIMSGHYYFRPIQGLVSMMRVRLIYQAFGVDRAVDVKPQLEELRKVFLNLNSQSCVAHWMSAFLPHLQRLELVEPITIEDPQVTIKLLQQVLMDEEPEEYYSDSYTMYKELLRESYMSPVP